MKTKIAGVSYYRRTGKWKAEITTGGKRLHLGYFATKDEAADARALAELDRPPAPARTVLQAAEPEDFDAAPPVAKPAGPPPFDRTRPPGPDNIGSAFIYDSVWADFERDGWIAKWVANGDRWRFERYGRLAQWYKLRAEAFQEAVDFA